jgi:hydroxysqualene dehydroxylase
MKTAVVGAGWAGLAAASQCLTHGMQVTLFDASHQAGGRARGVSDPLLGPVDNGQHLLIGAYEKTLELICRDVGAERIATSFKRMPLWLESADGKFSLRRRHRVKNPRIDTALALWSAHGLTLKDKWHITGLLRRLESGPHVPDSKLNLTVAQWLANEHQTENACRWLWHPLCLATMNTVPSEACAALFMKVLCDSLLSAQPDATDLLIPSCNLSDLWPSAVASKVTTRWGHVVRHLNLSHEGVAIDGEWFDACVLAVPPPSLTRLLGPLNGFESLASELEDFEFRAIATCYVGLEQSAALPAPLLMFDHADLNEENLAQWVFDRSSFMQSRPNAQLAFVISCADSLPALDDLDLARRLMKQLTRAIGHTQRGEITGARCFREKRATFAARPGLKRPGATTRHPRLVLAGDWTDTGYPSVIEGAVISGINAAEEIAQLSHKLSHQLSRD